MSSAIFEISRGGGGGLRNFRIYGGLANFQDREGWPMSDNVIFQEGSYPRAEDTMFVWVEQIHGNTHCFS